MNKRFIGIPYKLHGRDFTAADCYGVVYLYLKEQGYLLPKYEIDYTMTTARDMIAQEYSNVLGDRLEIPEDNCIVLFYRYNIPIHIGVCVGKNILHSSEKYDSVFEPIQALKRRYHHMENYRVNESYNTNKPIYK